MKIFDKVFSLFNKTKKIDENFFEELEESLISSGVGVKFSLKILDEAKNFSRKKDLNEDSLKEILKKDLLDELKKIEANLKLLTTPAIFIFIGANGVGKTTSIAKIAYFYKTQNKKVLLAGADTFRAAAGEQLEKWANLIGIPIIKGKIGQDAASLVYDAIESAKAKKYDLVLIDTAGRMENKTFLYEKLKKIYNVVLKHSLEVSENFLVLDATTGESSYRQVENFKSFLPLTGIILTKYDSKAKGGILIPIILELNIPVKLLGTGEKLEDLKFFSPDKFIEEII